MARGDPGGRGLVPPIHSHLVLGNTRAVAVLQVIQGTITTILTGCPAAVT